MAFKVNAPLMCLAVLCAFSLTWRPAAAQDQKPAKAVATQEALWKAAREGDLETIRSALQAGIDVDAKTEYGATALFFACDRGNEALVQLLLDQGADPNAKDTFYQATPMTWARQGHPEIVLMLLAHGGDGADSIFKAAVTSAIASGDSEYAQKVLDTGKVSEAGVLKARDVVLQLEDAEKKTELSKLFDGLGLPAPKVLSKLTPELRQRYAGKYKAERFTVDVAATDEGLTLGFNDQDPTKLVLTGPHEFSLGAAEIRFVLKDDQVTGLVLSANGNETKLTRSDEKSKSPEPDPKAKIKETPAAKQFGPSAPESIRSDREISSPNWPGFRGNGARGVAEGQNPPVDWNVSDDSDSENLLWKVPVPGLGLSCPTIWGDRVYLTSAVTDNDDSGLKIGLYGDVDSIEDDREYEFKLFCYSKRTGELVWERTANKTKPAVMRHAKSSHANPTVATDGDHVVAFFGSEGLYCYSQNGDLIWKRDWGLLDSGWFYDPGYQWGFGSSPLIYKDRVIVQCDIQDQSFVAALDLKTGNEIWRTDRDEIPTWSSPTVHQFGDTEMLITGGTKSARGYDVNNGELLWSLKGHSEIVVPTPFVAHNLIYIASGYSPIQPIYAIKPSARGDISLAENTDTNEAIPWSVKRGGPYMPSPVVYGDYLYCCSNSGILTCYVAKTGEQVYKQRIKASGGSLSFTASPIAADGHLYLTAEDGRVIVVRAGGEYEMVTVNPCGESILATPAISAGVIYFRTQDSLIAVGKLDQE